MEQWTIKVTGLVLSAALPLLHLTLRPASGCARSPLNVAIVASMFFVSRNRRPCENAGQVPRKQKDAVLCCV